MHDLYTLIEKIKKAPSIVLVVRSLSLQTSLFGICKQMRSQSLTQE